MFGSTYGHGYLPRYLGPHPALWGCTIGRHIATRWEEYAFVAEALEEFTRGDVLDAGCGANPDSHLLPLILGNAKHEVTALDRDPAVLQMPAHPRVTWVQGDMCATGFPDASFDYYVCVSVLEHLPPVTVRAVLAEAYRVLRPGGVALLTTDWMPAAELALTLREAGFNAGNEHPPVGEHLNPVIAWARARRGD